MATNAKKYLPLGLGLLFGFSAVLALFVMFKAGCTGDPKGGTLGDPVRALELEGVGLIPLLLSSVSGGAAIGLLSPSIYRIAYGSASTLLLFILLSLAGIQFEIWGVQSCF